MTQVPPRILDIGAVPPGGSMGPIAVATALDFSHVAMPAWAGNGVAQNITVGEGGVALIADINLFERDAGDAWVQEFPQLFAVRHDGRSVAAPIDPRGALDASGRALARVYQNPKQFMQLWIDELRRLMDAGAAGFRFRDPDRLGSDGWRELIGMIRDKAPATLLIADTAGLTRERLAGLRGCGFDYVMSSLAWWDMRAPWLIDEYRASLRVAPVLATVAASGRVMPAARQARDTQLALGVVTAMGTVVRHDFVDDEPGVNGGSSAGETIVAANRLIASHPIVAARGELKSLTGPGSKYTALIRGEAPSLAQSQRALIALVNPDPAVSLALTGIAADLEDWDLGHGEELMGGSGDQLAPGEARLFDVERRAAIRSPRRSATRGATAAANAPRIVIAGISPSVDDGAFAAKRTVGDTVVVEADIFSDGHTKLAAEILYRADDERTWQRVPMTELLNDRWRGTFPVLRIGRYRFRIEAWLDSYGGFARDLKRKLDARKPVTLDLEEGRAAIEEAAKHGERPIRKSLAAIAEGLSELDDAAKAAGLLASETTEAMRQADPRLFRVESADQLVDVDRTAATFSSWYELFPRSQTDNRARHGTFADVIARLPAIAEMGFDVLYLPPIHPIGRTNRKGRNNAPFAEPDDPGSVYAIGAAEGGHRAVHPELGSLRDFVALVKAARAQGIEIALDFAVQCSPDHPWLKEHPKWFDWRADGTIKYAENPPKVYEDIVNVDFYAGGAIPGLWIALRDIVQFWAKQDVRIFRVDNPHTKPFAFWQWMIADIRAADPDIIFLAEAFTRPHVMYHLAKLGFTQSYTYFTWRNTKDELTSYMRELTAPPVSDFFRPHFFVNTPDINPYFLQTSGRPGFLIRAVLAATLSGLWGVYSGFELCEAAALPGREEYLDSEKYEIKPRDWNAPGNIVAEIAQLNRFRRSEPALQTQLGLTFYNASNPNILLYGKHAPGERTRILVAVNLNPHGAETAEFELPLWEWELPDNGSLAVEDLLTGRHFVLQGKMQRMRLEPNAPYSIWRLQQTVEA